MASSPIPMDANYPLSTSIPATPGQSDFLRWMKNWVSDGILKGDLGTSVVSQRAAGANLSIDIATVRGIVRGVFFESGTALNLAIPPNAAAFARIDRLVIRLDVTSLSNPNVSFVLIGGTPSATPVAPDPVRTISGAGIPLIHDIRVALIAVAAGAVSILTADLTDDRQYLTGVGQQYWGLRASAATFVPPDGRQVFVAVTGTTPITAIPVGAEGTQLLLQFAAAGGSVVHNGTTLVLDGGRTYTAQPGGILTLQSTGAAWYEVGRTKERAAQNLVMASPHNTIGEVGLIALGTGHLPTGIANANLGTDTQGRVNHLINGCFELWQRGAGPFATSGVYTADRWIAVMGASSTYSLSRDAINIDRPSVYAATITYAHVTVSQLKQFMEDWRQFIGQTLTFTMRVKASAANAIRLALSEGPTGSNSAFHTGGGTYETLSVTHVFDGSTSEATAILDLRASGTFSFDRGTLVLGTIGRDGLPQQPAALQDECQRHYEVVGEDNTGSIIVAGNATGSAVPIYETIMLHTRKAAVPTITKNGTWVLQNTASGQPSVDSAAKDSFRLLVTSGAVTGTFFAHNGAAGATVTAETAP